ncbi:DUF6351 family protein [Phytoactinopolyspora endophytica]|uniref:DUF6351 family protein n=1 Tax=Phytoactinopolyspora endophytica TaxID=1642495 RepID=UPI00197CA555|nr:DUF6351 family protein [Phytoactinopolyspora endophytica]
MTHATDAQDRPKPGKDTRAWRAVLFFVLLLGLAVGATGVGTAQPVSGAADGRRTFTGEIDGAEYRVEMPEAWNGTLLLYSHGYHPEFWPDDLPIEVTNAEEAEDWLLDNGYALAASEFQNDGIGYLVEEALTDQIALLDWFEANIGQPSTTVATGQSMGAVPTILLSERYPDRFDGAATICGGPDPQATFNAGLDVTFGVKTLLAGDEDIELVNPGDPEGSTQALAEAVEAVMVTPEGRARLALIASFNNVQGWWSAHEPRPTEPEERIRQQANWILNAYVLGFAGPGARVNLEQQAGGNPSSNVGVDYRRQLLRSSQTIDVRRAYREAGLDLGADLELLADAPRIAADQDAVDYMYQFGVPTGTTPVPVVTLHTTGDGGATPDQERWYGSLVRRAGDAGNLRQHYVERGAHCSVSAAEEIVSLQTLLSRIDTGHWPNTSPSRLTAEAETFDSEYHQVLDFVTFTKETMEPAFTRYTPPKPQRPSR